MYDVPNKGYNPNNTDNNFNRVNTMYYQHTSKILNKVPIKKYKNKILNPSDHYQGNPILAVGKNPVPYNKGANMFKGASLSRGYS